MKFVYVLCGWLSFGDTRHNQEGRFHRYLIFKTIGLPIGLLFIKLKEDAGEVTRAEKNRLRNDGETRNVTYKIEINGEWQI